MWIDQRGSEILPRGECLRLVAVAAREGQVGRLGISRPGAPLVLPISFGYVADGVLVNLGPGRTADVVVGSLVAFETDHVDEASGEAWAVLVRGLATELADDEVERWRPSLPRPRVAHPGSRFVRIRPDVVTGRRFVATGSPEAPAPADPPAVPVAS
ncbi:MAG: pyridoxamine 5'-phosphate oxidase family protein [Actinomycetota bacterium]|jgi:nitroimidazol reductase NimA-like FMN-containing flavoprotein (pyridoxamine 5'-phosphate oxidase superfamily)|nr:pyridoxamine 5'-phosphate oxidase family protein [Actinomycetota bacterium]